MDKPFNCWKCTACCRACNKVDELKAFDRGDGVCINLLKNGDCAIYESRPEICNTKRMYEKHYASRLSWDEYVVYGEIICKILEKNMDKNKKI
jgi:Fe-S-cluster containining protein